MTPTMELRFVKRGGVTRDMVTDANIPPRLILQQKWTPKNEDSMSSRTLEKQRAARVAKAESRAGMREGVYVLRGHNPPHVRITIQFYPKEHWIVEDINVIGGAVIEGTCRSLTDDIRAKLESWL